MIDRKKIASILFYACVSLAPLPFGSHNPLAVAFWCVILALALAIAPVPQLNRSHQKVLAAVAFIAASFVTIVFLQSGVSPIAPPDKIWAEAAIALDARLDGRAEAVRGNAFLSMGPAFACGLSFCSGFLNGTSRPRAREILDIVLLSSAAYALYGITSTLSDPSSLLGRERPDYYGVVLGTFINRNTAATYFGSCAAIAVLLLCERPFELFTATSTKQTSPLSIFQDVIKLKAYLRALSLLLCLTALFMTNSRAGVLFSLMGILCATVMINGGILFRTTARTRWKISGSVALFAFFLIAGGSANHRFDTQGFSDEGRLDIYASVVSMIFDHPYLGVGLGSFASSFATYRPVPPSIWGIWDMAHSSPLELAAELGVPFAILVCMCSAAAWALMIRGFFKRRRDQAIPLIGATVTFIGFSHSSVDFSLQIPGYAIVFMAVFGNCLAQAFRTDEKPAKKNPVSLSQGQIQTDEYALMAHRELAD